MYNKIKKKISVEIQKNIEKGTVEFIPTYNNEEEEPVIFPGLFPNLLANGSTGIAVGMATSIPPHNAGEVASAALHLIKHPDARVETLLEKMPGPDFPTGGVMIEPASSIAESYRTGRGSFRLRARWFVEDLGRGQWRIVVDEIPYQVPKSRLIEKIAELINARRIPILADIRDESAEDVRIVLEPRSRNVEPAVLMETLFRQTDLETRFPLNMNVLIDGKIPKVCGLREVLRAFLDHRREVLQRRSAYRLDKIERRLEVLGGYIIAFLNLDRVIEIIRYEDEPKAVMMEEFSLTDRQAEAILNMRLRSLRKLEEMQLRQEKDELLKEQDELQKLLDSPARQRTRLKRDLNALRKEYGKDTALGARRTTIDEAEPTVEFSMDAMIEKEPVTVILSQKGWIRGAKGHLPLDQDFKYKEGDGPAFVIHAQTTDKLLLATDKGRFFTIGADNIPRKVLDYMDMVGVACGYVDVLQSISGPECIGMREFPFILWWLIASLLPILVCLPFIAIIMTTHHRQAQLDKAKLNFSLTEGRDSSVESPAHYDGRRSIKHSRKKAAQSHGREL